MLFNYTSLRSSDSINEDIWMTFKPSYDEVMRLWTVEVRIHGRLFESYFLTEKDRDKFLEYVNSKS